MIQLNDWLFLTLEGGEGSGKSSLARSLYDHFKDVVPTVLTRDPGSTDFGMAVRSILLDPNFKKRSKLSELYLYHACRADLVEQVLKPAREEKKLVICDRFFDSTWVYQGGIRGWDNHTLMTLDHITLGMDFYPHHTILCDVDPKVGLTRSLGVNDLRTSSGGNDESLWESMGLQIHEKINRLFRERATNSCDDWRFDVIDTTEMSEEEVLNDATSILEYHIQL